MGAKPEPERLRGWEEEGAVAPEAQMWGRGTGPDPTVNVFETLTDGRKGSWRADGAA